MLLDSNILIYAANGTAPALEALVVSEENAVASVTQIEVYGFTGLEPEERAALDILFQRLTVHALDDRVVQQAIALRQQSRMHLADAVIAATALVHQIPLVTRNTEDFAHVPGLHVVDPLAKERTV